MAITPSWPLVVSFDPREGLGHFELNDVLCVPEAACLICERVIDDKTWKEMLGQIDDPNAQPQVERVLNAPMHERFATFTTSGLSAYEVDGKSLERLVYGSIEQAFRRADASVASKFEAAFIMLRIYLQARNVLVVQGVLRDWFAGVLETAFEHVRPFVFRDIVSQIHSLCGALRSGNEMPVLLSVGMPSWRPHWTQNMRMPDVCKSVVKKYNVQAPEFCTELDRLSLRALEHVGETFYDELLRDQDNVSFTFDLFANMASLTGSAFNLSPLSTSYVFEEFCIEPLAISSSTNHQGGGAESVDPEELL